MRRALITTTINVPYNLIDWGRQLSPGDTIVVAGDRKSPHSDIINLLDRITEDTGVLTDYTADRTEWRVEDLTGWNTIRRRNIALLSALRGNPDYIITVDDDNYPSTLRWVSEVDAIFAGLGTSCLEVSTESGWFNAGELCEPRVTHRGFPLNVRSVTGPDSDEWRTGGRGSAHRNVGVFASLWLGAADVDAIERLSLGDRVDAVADDAVLLPGTWCPFNSQATAFRRELAPAMLMWPEVGRYDDIWASYLVRAITDALGLVVRYGAPTVTQQRNEHDLVEDLRQELFGMQHTPELVHILRHASAAIVERRETTVFGALNICREFLESLPWLPPQVNDMMRLWRADIRTLMRHYGISFEVRGAL